MEVRGSLISHAAFSNLEFRSCDVFEGQIIRRKGDGAPGPVARKCESDRDTGPIWVSGPRLFPRTRSIPRFTLGVVRAEGEVESLWQTSEHPYGN